MERMTPAEGKLTCRDGWHAHLPSSVHVLEPVEVLLCAFCSAEPETEWTVNDNLLN